MKNGFGNQRFLKAAFGNQNFCAEIGGRFRKKSAGDFGSGSPQRAENSLRQRGAENPSRLLPQRFRASLGLITLLRRPPRSEKMELEKGGRKIKKWAAFAHSRDSMI